MELIYYILLGLIQGFAEVLPISSSAHLIIFGNIFEINNENDGLTFEVFLHLASLIAIIIYLWPQLLKLLKGFFLYIFKKDKEYKLEFKYCLFLVISTIPTVIFSLLLGDVVEKAGSILWLVGLLLIINGTMLFVLSRIDGIRKEEDLNYIDACIIGLFQCAGVFPGISRSGSCLSGAFTRKIEKKTAAEYAFLMFIPAVIGATFYQVFKLLKSGSFTISNDLLGMYIISFVVTGITTYFAFRILLTIIKKGKLSWFSYYCFLVGLTVIIFDIIK